MKKNENTQLLLPFNFGIMSRYFLIESKDILKLEENNSLKCILGPFIKIIQHKIKNKIVIIKII